jgi:hypothetical protein
VLGTETSTKHEGLHDRHNRKKTGISDYARQIMMMVLYYFVCCHSYIAEYDDDQDLTLHGDFFSSPPRPEKPSKTMYCTTSMYRTRH